MTKAAKLRKKLHSVPSDFTWDELVTLLRGLGFDDISDKSGSYRTFASPTGCKIFVHKPHPGNVLKRYHYAK